ncbi:hypothetical protein QWZ06_06450 [Chryseobacterium tructae]|uniref:SMI1/KNR4 family protein n=1 Tax=Chryseobacterium tructae TaxID=1037380 RepID=A0ABV7XT92_9FLAO|nr:hypothetical protein [Chryseobacterium tructae]MDN3691921.1 hypothetical protein [Chryseobacterium tructae]
MINHQISFNNPYYANLENLLNNDLQNVLDVNAFLTELVYLNEHWEDMELREAFIEKEGGCWDWQDLLDFNATGNWFTFFKFEDLGGYINVDTKTFYLENCLLSNEAVIEMPLDEFIDVLQQWKNIISG